MPSIWDEPPHHVITTSDESAFARCSGGGFVDLGLGTPDLRFGVAPELFADATKSADSGFGSHCGSTVSGSVSTETLRGTRSIDVDGPGVLLDPGISKGCNLLSR